MNHAQQALYKRLQNFSIDKSYIDFSFDKRLTRENGWSLSYSRRVMSEYKKFLLLASTAGHPCTPSDQVDVAWHLHLTYTKSYWNDLCTNVLPAPLHHNPTEGGAAEGQKFEDWYERTRQSYRDIFGYEPPLDIWPPSQERFGKAPHFKRIDVADYWLISKKQVLAGSAWLSLTAMLLLFVTACSSEDNTSFVPLTIAVAVIGIFYWFLKKILANTQAKSAQTQNASKIPHKKPTKPLKASDGDSSGEPTGAMLWAASNTSPLPHQHLQEEDSDGNDNDSSSDSDSTSSDSGSSDSGCGSSGCSGCGGD